MKRKKRAKNTKNFIRLRPHDTTLMEEYKNLTARATMAEGGYDNIGNADFLPRHHEGPG